MTHYHREDTHRHTHSLTPSCSQTLRENSGSVTHPSGCCSVFLIVLICWKWQDISVLMTISITSVRSSLWEAQHSGSTELKAHALSQNRPSIPHRNGTSQDIMPALSDKAQHTSSHLSRGWPGCSSHPLAWVCRLRSHGGFPEPSDRCTGWPLLICAEPKEEESKNVLHVPITMPM